jgi:integrase/recombinase XerC
MGKAIEYQGRTFYEPKLRWKAGRAFMRVYDPERRPKQKDFPLHTDDKGAADILFQKRRFEYLHGHLDPWEQKRKDGVTLEAAVEKYISAQDVRASTVKCKRVRLDPFVRRHPGMLVKGVTEEQVRDYCYRRELKTGTQQRYLSEMIQFLDYCEREGWIAKNPAVRVQKGTPKRRKRQNRDLTEYLSFEEVEALLTEIERDTKETRRSGRRVLADVIEFAVYSGLRLGEISNLRWEDVRLLDSETSGGLYGWISVRNTEDRQTKTGDEDRVPIVPQAYELLKRLQSSRGSSGYVFESPRKGGSLSDWWVSNRFREYRRRAGLRDEIHFHSLRHTCASWLAECGVDLKTIQEIMRHSNIKQTMRYAHLIPEVVARKMVGAFERIGRAKPPAKAAA